MSMATKTKQGLPPVPVEEIAGRLGRQMSMVTTALETRDAPLFSDWSGRLVTSWEAAGALVEDLEAQKRENDAAQRAYKNYLEKRERDRHQAGVEAYEQAMDVANREHAKSLKGEGFAFLAQRLATRSTPHGRTAGREARREALEKFDRKNPELDFQEWRKKHG